MTVDQQTNKQETAPAVPVTVIGGFLGAGKTTLLNHILNGNHGKRIAVVVNDFGSINIDSELISDVSEGMVSLANGCICCVIRSDLVSAVLKLAEDEDQPEQIIIESSGVADPASVERALMLPQIWSTAQYTGTISVVDADQVLNLTDELAELAQKQINGADLLVLNKVDLVDETRLDEVRTWINRIKPGSQCLETTYCNLPVEVLLGAPSREHSGFRQKENHGSHEHSSIFESWSFESEQPLYFNTLQLLLRRLPKEVVRMKGFVFISKEPETRYLLQMVGRRATISRSGIWGSATPQTRLVLIAEKETVNFDAVERALNECAAE